MARPHGAGALAPCAMSRGPAADSEAKRGPDPHHPHGRWQPSGATTAHHPLSPVPRPPPRAPRPCRLRRRPPPPSPCTRATRPCCVSTGVGGGCPRGVPMGCHPGVSPCRVEADVLPAGVLAVLRLEAAALGECELARLLQDQLRYEKRLQYTVPGLPASRPPHPPWGAASISGGPKAGPPPRQPLVLFPLRPPGRSTTSPSDTRCGSSTRRC